MNPYIEQQRDSMITLLESFKQTCKVAAMKNDGMIDGEEKRTLAKINTATDKYKSTIKD